MATMRYRLVSTSARFLPIAILLAGACAPAPAPQVPLTIAQVPTSQRIMAQGATASLAELRPIDRALTDAVKNGEVDKVRKLLAEGANANVRYEDGENLLCTLGPIDPERAVQIARLLVEHGADVNHRSELESHTPLIHAVVTNANTELLVRFLLSKGAKVNEPIQDGITALHLAVLRGRPGVVRELLEYGANTSARTTGYHAPSQAKNGMGLPDPGYDFNVIPPEPNFRLAGRTPIHMLSVAWSSEMFAIFQAAKVDFSSRDDNGWTALHYAAALGSLPSLDAFLKTGLDPNAASRGGYRPVHLATRPSLGDPQGRILRRLRTAGADFQAKNGAGQTPVALLRADIRSEFARRAFPTPIPKDQVRAQLANANAVAKLIDPQAPLIVAPKPKEDALGIYYPDLNLGPFQARRAVRVDGDRAILTLIVDPSEKVASQYRIDDIRMGYYETRSPMPKLLKLKAGRPITLRFEFPAVATKDLAVDVHWSYTPYGKARQTGSYNEGRSPTPRFRGRLNGPIEATHEILKRTVAFQILSARRDGKPLETFPRQEFLLESRRHRPIPGIDRLTGLELAYRVRVLPNRRWTEERARFF
jgi:ankyrin repeat protein